MSFCGKRPRHGRIELCRLVWAHQRAHREDMRQRSLLQFAHDMMRAVNRCSYFWALAMFSVDRTSKLGIVGAQLAFECAFLDRETGLQRFELSALASVEIELVVQEVMQLDP